jgi:cytochrome b561
MPTTFDTHLLIAIAFAALVVWRIYSRIRRVIGRQRLSKARPWITVVVFPLIFVLLLATSLAHPAAGAAAIAGALVGVFLGVLGTRLTKFEVTPAGLFYTPNAHLGIALSLLLVVRLAWRFVVQQTAGRGLDPQSMQIGSSPLTMAIFGTLAGYYVTYAIGLLRWRARVSEQTPAEH